MEKKNPHICRLTKVPYLSSHFLFRMCFFAIFSFIEGCRLSESDDHNKAILFFTKAINLKPEVDKYYVTRGESYLHICDFQSAILNFKKACILDPDNEQTYSRLAFLYFLQGQCLFDEKLYSEALESFSRAAEMKPEVIGYHTRRFVAVSFSFSGNFKTPLVRPRPEGPGKSNNNYYYYCFCLHLLVP